MTQPVGAARARVLLDRLEQEIVDLDALVLADAQAAIGRSVVAEAVTRPDWGSASGRAAVVEPPD